MESTFFVSFQKLHVKVSLDIYNFELTISFHVSTVSATSSTLMSHSLFWNEEMITLHALVNLEDLIIKKKLKSQISYNKIT